MQAIFSYFSEKYTTEKKSLDLTGKMQLPYHSYWACRPSGYLMGCFCAGCHPFFFGCLMKEVTWHKILGNSINGGFIPCVKKGVSIFKHCPKITFLNLTVETFPDYMF